MIINQIARVNKKLLILFKKFSNFCAIAMRILERDVKLSSRFFDVISQIFVKPLQFIELNKIDSQLSTKFNLQLK